MLVNGKPLDEPYLKLPPGVAAASGVVFQVRVPPDSLWVMGDNRYNSLDSRAHQESASRGFVSYSDVAGRAFAIIGPVSRLSWLGRSG
ncbi:signal peptidase I [Leifsonia xyli]|uniref:signal peptidase I n=1 Tax=Leifsonia xyli TaxID=1575 RepID=UPI00210A43DC|nr:signal peptidase I [Leifsonia xyli]